LSDKKLFNQTHEERNKAKRTLQKLNEKHRMVMRLDLAGKSNKQIANVTGYSYQSVAQIKSDENYKKTKQAMRAELDDVFIRSLAEDVVKDPVRRRLEDLKLTAMDVNEELMQQAESENVRMKCAHDILDRAGYKPKDILKHEGGLELNDEKMKSDIKTALSDIRKTVQSGKDNDIVQRGSDSDEK